MNKILEVKNIETSFFGEKTVYAVQGASFDLYEGEVFGLVGESGCGKSVLCRSILNILKKPGRIVSGEVLLKGTNLVGLSDREMTKLRGSEISMIFQEPMTALNPVLSVREQMYEALKDDKLSAAEKEKRTIELFKLVGIPSPEVRLDEYPHQFSGGMRQRVMIAAGIAANPSVLLADEPTTALDVTIQNQIMELILDLKDRLGMSIVLVTHDLGVVAQMCDRIAVMYAGKIVEMADTITLFSQPKHPYTIGLMRSIPSMVAKGERLNPIDGNPPDLSVKISGCSFYPRCDFREDDCLEQDPPLVILTDNHFSKCLHIDKLKSHRGLIEVE